VAETDTHARTHATTEELLEAVFPVRSVPRLHIEGQLPLEARLETAVRRVGGWSEMATSLGASGVESSLVDSRKLWDSRQPEDETRGCDANS
jgi:hypothetical protein